MNSPTLAGFVAWLRGYAGITTAILPDNSPYIGWAYTLALDWTNQDLCIVGTMVQGYPTVYALAVYNLGGHILITQCPDQPNAAPIDGSKPPLPYFAFARQQWGINSFVSGVIQSTNDNGTGNSMVVPDAFKGLTIANLDQLKSPYGRQYLAFAQSMGPTIIGVS